VTEPTLVPNDALAGVRVALSVSDSADLRRLGLTETHCRLVVAEVARAVLLAGGIIVYGGRLRPPGYTQVVMEQVRRYGDEREALEIYVPSYEYRDIPIEDLACIDGRLGASGVLRLISATGEVRTVAELRIQPADRNTPEADALTAMRRLVTERTAARIAVGGKLSGYGGSEPGVIEEARLTLEASRPLYLAGGYGGAAAAIARALDFDTFAWAPHDFPDGAESEKVRVGLARIKSVYEASTMDDGLTPKERRFLAVSHRPSNIATLAVLGLSRVVGSGTL
jgi:hypothetical protein